MKCNQAGSSSCRSSCMADFTADTSEMMLHDTFIILVILEAYSKFSLSFNRFLKL